MDVSMPFDSLRNSLSKLSLGLILIPPGSTMF